MLELFSGTKRVSSIFSKRYEPLTLDNDPATEPDVCVDVMEWEYTEYPPGYFAFIWASPDCTTWSIASHKHRILTKGALTQKARDAEEQIMRVLEIIRYFRPEHFIIENPRGRLRHFPPMWDIMYRTTVYYGNYGAGLVKPTDIWSNTELWEPEKVEDKGRRPEPKDWNCTTIPKNRRLSRSIIPERLIQRIFNYLHY